MRAARDSSLERTGVAKGADDILSYLGVGLHLSARRLPPPLLRACFVALSSDFAEGTFIFFPESTA